MEKNTFNSSKNFKVIEKQTTQRSSTKVNENSNFNRAWKQNEINDTCIITISNCGYRDFVLNWIISLKRNGYSKFLVLCYEEKLLQFLLSLGYQKTLY